MTRTTAHVLAQPLGMLEKSHRPTRDSNTGHARSYIRRRRASLGGSIKGTPSGVPLLAAQQCCSTTDLARFLWTPCRHMHTIWCDTGRRAALTCTLQCAQQPKYIIDSMLAPPDAALLPSSPKPGSPAICSFSEFLATCRQGSNYADRTSCAGFRRDRQSALLTVLTLQLQAPALRLETCVTEPNLASGSQSLWVVATLRPELRQAPQLQSDIWSRSQLFVDLAAVTAWLSG